MKIRNLRSGFYLIWPVILIGLILLVRSFVAKGGSAYDQKLYEFHCLNCHQEAGQGVRRLIPPLAKSDYLEKHRDELACIIRQGMTGEIIVNGISFNHPMPGNETLTEFQIHRILSYIMESWGNELESIPLEEVKTALENCPQ